MKTLREAVGDYLALRRSLGFKLKKHQRLLEEFALFLEQEGTSQITSRLALLWATQPQHIQASEWAARLSAVRGFARYWSATDATTEVPPDGLIVCSRGRITASSVFWPSQVCASVRHSIFDRRT